MKQMFFMFFILTVSTLSLVGCGDPATQPNGSSINQSVATQSQAVNSSVCAPGMGIFTSADEFKSFIQNKINTGAFTHCVTLDGQRLSLTSPNGLFGPCFGAISQANATYNMWASCSSTIQ